MSDPQNNQGIDWAKWLSLVLSVLALGASTYQFYLGSLREVHDFRAVEVDYGVILINAGNRTEVLTSVSRLYAPPPNVNKARHGTMSVGPIVLKAGDAQFIKLPVLGDDEVMKYIGPVHKSGYAFTILNTGFGANKRPTISTEVFNWVVEVFPEGGSAGGGHDMGYVDLYTGKQHR